MKQTSGAEIKKALEKVEASLPATRDSLIPALQAVQEKLGWLPQAAMLGIGKYLKVPESQVWGTASFYAQFRFTPVGKNILTVCRGTACHVRGSAGILSELEKEMGIQAGETTPDMMFSLEKIACLGSCALAPVMVVNAAVHGAMNPAKGKGLLEGIRRQSRSRKKAARKSKTRRAP